MSPLHTYSMFFTVLITILLQSSPTSSQSHLCRSSCGNIPINYPFSIDDGCGSPYYRHMLICSDNNTKLQLRTPSGKYPVKSISYSDPHLLISDPYMWKCQDRDNFRPTRSFSIDSSTHFTVSLQNDYLFFNCDPEKVIVEPKPLYCERFPDRCDSSCDSSSYLCRHLPECGPVLGSRVSCCSYYPKATQSLRLMLQNCATYTSVYWRSNGAGNGPYDQVAEYGIRVDYEFPVTMKCLLCQETTKGGGVCGFDTRTQEFLCLCKHGNVTTYCKDPNFEKHKRIGAVAGTVTAVSSAGAIGVVGGIFWYLRKVRAKAPVTCGVESNENRIF
ncbi:GUB_WAK_bind domain-containing protein [Hirschfeldia incana]|nr:GUB_WAK_bind domain-containing protein [Hirschfeldia incana]